jgi:hypothetical protein
MSHVQASLGWHRLVLLLIGGLLLLAMVGCSGAQQFRSESMNEELDSRGGYYESASYYQYDPL